VRPTASFGVLAERAQTGHYALVAGEATVEVIGVHPVPDVPACFLVEAMIEGSTDVPDFGLFTQRMEDRPRSEWQVAYDEQLLNDGGERVLTDVLVHPPTVWPHRARVAFYLHNLDADRPLVTPFGEVALPRPSESPSRLSFLRYEAP
jgi:hypothetical protein